MDLTKTTHTNPNDYPNDPWTFTDPTGNYKDASGTVHDAINQANATITVTLYSVPYDSNPHTATGTATGVCGDDLLSRLGSEQNDHTNAGDYPNDPWAFHDPAGNYKDASGTVHDQIMKATTTVDPPTGNPSKSTFGEPVTFSTAVHPQLGGIPTGTVTYTVNGMAIPECTGLMLDQNGKVPDCMTSTLPVGNPDQIQATYSGDVNFQTNSGSSGYVVGTATTTTALSAVPDQSMGSSYLLLVTFTATVTGQFGGNPTGFVEFTENGADIPGCAKVAVATQQNGGVAICGTTSLPVGSGQDCSHLQRRQELQRWPQRSHSVSREHGHYDSVAIYLLAKPVQLPAGGHLCRDGNGGQWRHTHRDFDLYQ